MVAESLAGLFAVGICAFGLWLVANHRNRQKPSRNKCDAPIGIRVAKRRKRL